MASLASVTASRNRSRLELALVVVMVGVLAVLFLQRMERVEAAMERAMVQLVIQDMQSRLLMHQAEITMRGEQGRMIDLIGANPVERLALAPAGYLGERERVDWGEIEPGTWVYDRARRTLGYRVVHEAYFDGAGGSTPERIELGIAPEYEDLDADGVFDAARDRLLAVRLRPAAPYRWDIQ